MKKYIKSDNYSESAKSIDDLIIEDAVFILDNYYIDKAYLDGYDVSLHGYEDSGLVITNPQVVDEQPDTLFCTVDVINPKKPGKKFVLDVELTTEYSDVGDWEPTAKYLGSYFKGVMDDYDMYDEFTSILDKA